MDRKQKFRAVIEEAGGGGAYVTIPFDVEKTYGKKRVKVKATFNGEPYRGSLVRMGGTSHILGVLKSIRQKLGKTYGDELEITLELDTEPREVELPQDFKEELDRNPEAQVFFTKLAYSHQKKYIQWIEEAKREQTRVDRMERAIAMLKKGEKK